jgi:hypothetical protein
MPQKLSFLFGSGISIPAGMPCVNQITEKVRSGTGVMRHNNGHYDFGQPLYAHAGFPDEYVPTVVEFLKRLSVEIERYYSFDPERAVNVNYEDLYYVAAQIDDSELGEYDNPVVQAFVDKIEQDLKHLFIRQANKIGKELKLGEVASEATNYIRDIVWRFLAKEPAGLNYLGCVRDAYQDTEISSLDLFTLNHDIVIERYLEGCDIEYTDGFGAPEHGICYWSPKVFEDSSRNVRLLKLHGSVNWFQYEPHGVGIADNEPHSLYKDPNGQWRQLLVSRPILLAGTFNKMLQYTGGIYADLFCELRRALRETQLLIVCGYGFGDKGINSQVVEWADSSDRNAMVVIDPKLDSLKRRARPAVSSNWERLLRSNRLAFLQRSIKDTSWKDIKDAIQK